MDSHRRTLAAAIATILASLSLYPIFIGTAWFWAGVGSVATVALAGTLTRLRRLPVTVCMLGGLAALTLYLNIAFENAQSWYHLLPTPHSLRLLWDLAGTGFHQSAKYAPPVPELTGMMLLTGAGIGLTALLTDTIAVRLESAALAGLPLLLLYTEPFTLSVSRSGLGTTIVFCLGTAGYLALLSSEGKERIKEWERPDPGPDEIPDTRVLSMTGRRVGLASVMLALCVPLFIPGLHTTRLFGGQPGIGGNAGGGPGAVGFPNPDTQLTRELHETKNYTVLKYSNNDPAGEGQYLQLYVLDNLTADSGWQLSTESLVAASPNLPPPPGLTSEGKAYATQVDTTVEISQAVSQDVLGALPVPYPAQSVLVPETGNAGTPGAPDQLQADKNSLMVFGSVPLAGLNYSVTSLDVAPPPGTINPATPAPSSITGRYLEVPSSYNGLRAYAENVAKRATEKTTFGEAYALQQLLSRDGGFKYSLNAPTIKDASGLENFLKVTRTGYCQQFAFAMAVLARMLGIPSRVAYGFTSGTRQPDGLWTVTLHDAHSWPELYFQGYGWLRFEPTPAGLDGQGTATAPSYTAALTDPFKETNPVQTPANPGPSAFPSTGAGHVKVPQLTFPENGFGGDTGSALAPARTSLLEVFLLGLLGLFSLLGLLALVAVAPACARILIRRRRWRSGERGGDAALAHAAWRELRDDLVDYRAGYQPSESPRALAARIGAALEMAGHAGPAMAALHSITMAEERARYAARPDLGAGLRQDSAVVRHALAAAASRRTRWLAWLAPSSVLGPAMIRVALVADFSSRLSPGWLGRRLGLGGGRFGRGWPADARSAGAGGSRGAGGSADEAGGDATRSGSAVGAGARR